ncbi:MAG: Lrp/AsnC family transcriptional regulator [Candidatus Dormibacteraeota bacterium]|nr:Lrp/AsnC family transcriptional regulator [Candidatus Dormibacteraeota bacterium]
MSKTKRTGTRNRERPASHGLTATPLDPVDRRILEALAGDARQPVAQLARAAGVSRTQAYARLERLRTEGVIEGFSARIDPAKVGLGLTAFVLVSGRQPAWRTLRQELARMPEVEYCAFTTGEYDALLLVRVPDVQTLRDVILERLQTSGSVRATQTIFALDEVVHKPFVLPVAR